MFFFFALLSYPRSIDLFSVGTCVSRLRDGVQQQLAPLCCRHVPAQQHPVSGASDPVQSG